MMVVGWEERESEIRHIMSFHFGEAESGEILDNSSYVMDASLHPCTTDSRPQTAIPLWGPCGLVIRAEFLFISVLSQDGFHVRFRQQQQQPLAPPSSPCANQPAPDI